MAKRLGNLVVTTLAALADHLETPISTVSKWVRHPAWTWPRKSPWVRSEKAAMLRWAADKLEATNQTSRAGRPTTTDPDSERALRREKLVQEVRKLRAQADQAETSLAKERGKLLESDVVSREWAAVGVVVRNSLENLPSQIVPLALTHGIPHEVADQFRGQIEGLIAGVLRHLGSHGPESIEPILSGAVPA